MKRLSAASALGRGIANLRANRELIPLAAGGSMAIAAIVLLSILPWASSLGLKPEWFVGSPPEAEDLKELVRGLGPVAELLPRLGGMLLSFALALTLTSVLYCWYFGGILGVLFAGDAQAPPGGDREPALFRTFAWPLFVHEGSRLLWRLMLYIGLFLLFWLLLAVVVVLAFAAAGMLGQESGFGVGCAVACGALLPILFVAFALFGAMAYGEADLVRPASGVFAACAAGFRTLSRRLGATLLVMLVLFGASFGIALFSSAVDLFTSFALAGAAAFAFKALLLVVELVLGAVVNLAVTAAFIALYRDDAALPAAEPA